MRTRIIFTYASIRSIGSAYLVMNTGTTRQSPVNGRWVPIKPLA